jgi:transcription antitermination factor NusG
MQSRGSSQSDPKGGEQFLPGEKVMITSGMFQSFTGTILSVDAGLGTLKVLISFMSAWRTVELPTRDVTKVL